MSCYVKNVRATVLGVPALLFSLIARLMAICRRESASRLSQIKSEAGVGGPFHGRSPRICRAQVLAIDGG